MLTYRIEDMTCGHCASTITKAVHAVDDGAHIEVDLARHLVHIEPAEADSQTLSKAIAKAGYSPEPVETFRESTPAPTGRCCCDSGASSCRS